DVTTSTPDKHEVAVPTWSAARFLVVRAQKTGGIKARMSSLKRAGIRWHRLDEDVASWLIDPDVNAKAPTTKIPEADAWLRWIVAAKKALAPAQNPGVAEWLTVRWLEGTYAERPLIMPYFEVWPVAVVGGSKVKDLDALGDASAWYSVRASKGKPEANKLQI